MTFCAISHRSPSLLSFFLSSFTDARWIRQKSGLPCGVWHGNLLKEPNQEPNLPGSRPSDLIGLCEPTEVREGANRKGPRKPGGSREKKEDVATTDTGRQEGGRARRLTHIRCEHKLSVAAMAMVRRDREVTRCTRILNGETPKARPKESATPKARPKERHGVWHGIFI